MMRVLGVVETEDPKIVVTVHEQFVGEFGSEVVATLNTVLETMFATVAD